MSNLEVALTLAAGGLPAFPCGPDKKPLVKWREASTTDQDQIAALWLKHPNALVGIDLGKAGLVVFDGDRHADGPDGVEALRELIKQHGFEAKAAPTVRTPGNGVHVYMKQNGTVLTNSRGDLPAGIDIRGSGGYFIAPGSTLPDGRSYQAVAETPDLVSAVRMDAIPVAPEWLIKLVKPERSQGDADLLRPVGAREEAYAQAALRGCASEMARAPKGQRNEMLNALAFRCATMAARGWISEEDIARELASAATSCGLAGEDRLKAIEATISSGIKAGLQKPHEDLQEERGDRAHPGDRRRGARFGTGKTCDADPGEPIPLFRAMPPAGPFPVDALGDLLSEAARAIQARVQAPVSICAQSVLAAATLAVQAHADLQLPNGHRKPLSAYFCSVAASGERKSAVDAEALWPIRKHEAALREQYSQEYRSYENDHLAWTKAREEAVKKGKGDRFAIKTALDRLGPAPDRPLLPILTLDEPNWPGLCRAFDEGQPSLGLFSAEGGAFLGGDGMSADNRLRTATGLCTLWDGDPIRRARAGDGVRVLPGRRLSVHLMFQPMVADRLLGDPVLSDQGLTSRLLVVAPETTAGTRMWKEMPEDAEAAIRRYGARLLAILETPAPTSDESPAELAPRFLQLSPDARALWIATADAIEKQVGAGGTLVPVISLANKAPEHAARIAAVITLIADLNATEVSAEAMAAGVELVDFYLSEALRIQAGAQVSSDLQLAKRLLDWLATWPEPVISASEIYRLGPGAIREKKVAMRMVNILLDHGYLHPAGPGAVAGIKRRETWTIRRR